MLQKATYIYKGYLVKKRKVSVWFHLRIALKTLQVCWINFIKGFSWDFYCKKYSRDSSKNQFNFKKFQHICDKLSGSGSFFNSCTNCKINSYKNSYHYHPRNFPVKIILHYRGNHSRYNWWTPLNIPQKFLWKIAISVLTSLRFPPRVLPEVFQRFVLKFRKWGFGDYSSISSQSFVRELFLLFSIHGAHFIAYFAGVNPKIIPWILQKNNQLLHGFFREWLVKHVRFNRLIFT